MFNFMQMFYKDKKRLPKNDQMPGEEAFDIHSSHIDIMNDTVWSVKQTKTVRHKDKTFFSLLNSVHYNH